MKKCPDCAEQVQPDARVCRYCGHKFAQPREGDFFGRHWKALTALATVLCLAVVAGVVMLVVDPFGSDDEGCVSRLSGNPVPCSSTYAIPASESGERADDAADEERAERARLSRATRVLERTITKDAQGDVTDGTLDGPIKRTSCERVGGGAGQTEKFECLAIQTTNSNGVSEGYSYDGTVNLRSGDLTWELG